MSRRIESVRVGSATPWGRADHAEVLALGIVQVSTPGHGGVHLDPVWNAAIHPAWRASNGWYEEDCEVYIVAAAHPHAFPRATPQEVHDALYYWFTDEHAQAYPEEHARRAGTPTSADAMRELRARAAE